MGKHSRANKFGRRVGFFLLASLGLVAGAFAIWYLVLAPEGSNSESVNKADSPKVSQAPKPSKNASDGAALVAVPKIPSDATQQKALKLLESKDLKLGDVKNKTSKDVDKGKVMSQSPQPGKKVKKGSAVGITLSTGAKEVVVPDIPYGATQKEAESLLKSKNLKLGKVDEKASTDIDKGGVMLQDPLPDKKVKEGSAVGITLSAGPNGPDQAATEKDQGSADPGSAPTPSSSAMSLTVPAMGKVNEPIGEGVDEGTLYNGAGHAPTTGYPWIPGSNTYIAGHVLGYAGTGSYMDFAALPNMSYGDKITITDANGTNYNYTVSEILQVSIYDLWVLDPTGKDQVSLQTCINPPAYDVRLIVRGDLTSVDPA